MKPIVPFRRAGRLNIEHLEDRCPASTTLDFILAGLWLQPWLTESRSGANDAPVFRDFIDLSAYRSPANRDVAADPMTLTSDRTANGTGHPVGDFVTVPAPSTARDLFSQDAVPFQFRTVPTS